MSYYNENSLTIEKMVSEKVKDFLKQNHYRLVDVAKEFGISEPALSRHLNGKKFLNFNIANKFSQRFGFNIEFLQTGKGSMFLKDVDIEENINSEYSWIKDIDYLSIEQNTIVRKIKKNEEMIARKINLISSELHEVMVLRSDIINFLDELCNTLYKGENAK